MPSTPNDLTTLVLGILALVGSIIAAIAGARRSGTKAAEAEAEAEALKQEIEVIKKSNDLAQEVSDIRTGDTSSDRVSDAPLPDKWLRD